MDLKNLVNMSNKYGNNPNYVLAGGGNTSFKENGILYVKGSGTALATITENGFVLMDREKLNRMMSKTYSLNDDQREAEALCDMMDARIDKINGGRPSVEALLHNLFPQKYVLRCWASGWRRSPPTTSIPTATTAPNIWQVDKWHLLVQLQ